MPGATFSAFDAQPGRRMQPSYRVLHCFPGEDTCKGSFRVRSQRGGTQVVQLLEICTSNLSEVGSRLQIVRGLWEALGDFFCIFLSLAVIGAL